MTPAVGLDFNLLFSLWLEAKAAELQKRKSHVGNAYTRAAESVSKHPEPLDAPRKLKALPYVGEKIVEFLASKLVAHCKEGGVEVPGAFSAEKAKPDRQLDVEGPKKKKRKWVPKRRSGAWAILLTLYTKDRMQRGMSKQQIVEVAAAFCDSSFTANHATREFYSAWDGVNRLLSHEFVECVGRAPKLHLLTESGKALAALIAEQEGIALSDEEADMSFDNGVRVTPESSRIEPDDVAGPRSSPIRRQQNEHNHSDRTLNGTAYDVWSPEEYDVVLLFDNREVRSQAERDYFQRRIASHNVECDVRPLAVGDVLWIARHKQSKQEVALNYVCERKRMDDLALSIRDGRFLEQKARLKRSGLHNVYYVVEEALGEVDRIMEMHKAIETAISSVVTVSKLFFHRFRKADDTIDWLALMTLLLQKRYSEVRLLVLKPKTVESQNEYLAMLAAFRARFETRKTRYECVHCLSIYQATLGKSKMTTVREVFVKMLMLVRGVSFQKACVIQQHFGVPRRLIEYYRENVHLTQDEKEGLLFKLFRNQVGPKKLTRPALVALYETWGKL